MTTIEYKKEQDILKHYKKIYKFFLSSSIFLFFIVFILIILKEINLMDNFFIISFTIILFLLSVLLSYFNRKYSLSLKNIDKITISELNEILYLAKLIHKNTDSLDNYFENVRFENRELYKYDYYHIKTWFKIYEKELKTIENNLIIKKEDYKYKESLEALLNKKY